MSHLFDRCPTQCLKIFPCLVLIASRFVSVIYNAEVIVKESSEARESSGELESYARLLLRNQDKERFRCVLISPFLSASARLNLYILKMFQRKVASIENTADD